MSSSVTSWAALWREVPDSPPTAERGPCTRCTSESPFQLCHPFHAAHMLTKTQHRFMDLSAAEVGYFITQVADSAASFGVAKADLTVVGNALNGLFGMRCSAPATAVKAQGPQLQAICIDSTCPLAPNATCSAYQNATEPSVAVSSLVPSATSSSTPGSTSAPATTGGAASFGFSLGAVALGLAAFLL